MTSFKTAPRPSSPESARSARLPSVSPPGPSLHHYLMPGHLFAAREPTSVTTIVGSCVAISLWEPSLCMGGVNHYVLPRCPDRAIPSGRFGDTALELLLGKLAELGAPRRSLLARIVGGACTISAFRERESNLGRQNVEIGIALLREAGIRVIQEDTGGSQGRKLIFRTDNGHAVVQPL
jgi:chemotaxis protein CheD